MKLLRKILIPIVPFYFLVTWLRNWLYDKGFKKSLSYTFPIICVGNLSVGGTGKTPMIEYLIRLLKDNYSLATLSRGYGRKTKGFILGDKNSSSSSIGDEPLQFYKKFDDILVAVDADRQNGIELIRSKHPVDVILLDDAFQHRKVKAGLNLLLTSFDNLYSEDILLPTGDLREPKSGSNRADIIIVTKCPANISETNQKHIFNSLKLKSHQKLFFSWIDYDNFIYGDGIKQELSSLIHLEVALVTGIANPTPFLDYLTTSKVNYKHFKFADHHNFTDADIIKLKKEEIILTTEKDYVRLAPYFKGASTRLYYLPIRFVINQEKLFNQQIMGFLESY